MGDLSDIQTQILLELRGLREEVRRTAEAAETIARGVPKPKPVAAPVSAAFFVRSSEP